MVVTPVAKNRIPILFLFAALALAGHTAGAEEMRFLPGGHDVRCEECSFIQAIGTITEATPAKFAEFVENTETAPKRIRLHSPGGNLAAGLKLGEAFRELGFATEVGADREIGTDEEVCPEKPNVLTYCTTPRPFFGNRASVRKPGTCASACAYAFLGGVERAFQSPSKLGFHRFYIADTLSKPIGELLAGKVMDDAQQQTASLVLYALKMGVDAEVVALAAEAGADDMHWVSDEEAIGLGIRYQPNSWKPWRLETRRGGVVALSEIFDGSSSMMAYCLSNGMAFVELSDRGEDWDVAAWFEQNRTCPFEGKHPVFGELVPPGDVNIIKGDGGWATMRFQLKSKTPALTTPELLDMNTGAYPTACSSVRFQGSSENFKESVRVAMQACLSE